MKIVNLHDDLGYDILDKKKKGNDNALVNEHLPKLKKGEIFCNAVACFFSGTQSWKEMQEMVFEANSQIESCSEHFLKKNSKINDTKINLFVTVEGMCGIDSEVEERIDWLADHNVLIGSLCWNEENALVTGVKGNFERGLTELGKKAIVQMNKRKIILDVSHLNDKSLFEVLEFTNKPVIATHSNSRSLCDHPRNLTDEQLIAIGKNGGLIGLNAARYFVDEIENNQDVLHLAKHAWHIAKLIGVDKVTIGFDFMDYLEGYNGAMAKGIESADVSQNFIVALSRVGFNKDEIRAIAYENVLAFFKKHLDIN